MTVRQSSGRAHALRRTLGFRGTPLPQATALLLWNTIRLGAVYGIRTMDVVGWIRNAARHISKHFGEGEND